MQYRRGTRPSSRPRPDLPLSKDKARQGIQMVPPPSRRHRHCHRRTIEWGLDAARDDADGNRHRSRIDASSNKYGEPHQHHTHKALGERRHFITTKNVRDGTRIHDPAGCTKRPLRPPPEQRTTTIKPVDSIPLSWQHFNLVLVALEDSPDIRLPTDPNSATDHVFQGDDAKTRIDVNSQRTAQDRKQLPLDMTPRQSLVGTAGQSQADWRLH
jgi:hypothetical protein